jgi:hypothetical protein
VKPFNESPGSPYTRRTPDAFNVATTTSATVLIPFLRRWVSSCWELRSIFVSARTIAVALYDQLQTDGTLSVTSGGITLTPAGAQRLRSLGVDTEAIQAGRRPLARSCLDWTERRDHLAGALGAALLSSFRAHKWLTPRSGPRALRLTAAGRRALVRHFDIDVSTLMEVREVSHL